MDVTPQVSTVLVSTHQSDPIRPHRHDPAQLDIFLQEAYHIHSHIASLVRYLRHIRQPYLSTAAPPPKRTRADTRAPSSPVSALYLTDSQRSDIDTETSTLLQDLSGKISSLTTAESVRSSTATALLEHRYGKPGAGKNALWRWAIGGGSQEEEDANSMTKSADQIKDEGEGRTIKVVRESILWHLGTQLQQAVEMQRGMVEVRAAREREKEKSIPWKAGSGTLSSGGQIPRNGWNKNSESAEHGLKMVNGGIPNHYNRSQNSDVSFIEEEGEGKEDELTTEMRQLFESENSALLEHYETSLCKVQAAEKSLLEIANLQQTLVGHLSTQGEMVEQLVQDAAGTGENVQKGNRELKRAGERWSRGLARGVFYGTVGLCSFCVVWDLIF